MPSQLPSFDDPDLARAAEMLTLEELDALPFGVVRLDSLGRVILFSATEAALSGYDAPLVVGRPFFTDIAPCMGAPHFQGRIERAALAGKVDIELIHVGDFSDREREIHVRVLSSTGGGLWIFLQRL